eukprot:10214275-Lingulodinium_polyedra.AAC.1
MLGATQFARSDGPQVEAVEAPAEAPAEVPLQKQVRVLATTRVLQTGDAQVEYVSPRPDATHAIA